MSFSLKLLHYFIAHFITKINFQLSTINLDNLMALHQWYQSDGHVLNLKFWCAWRTSVEQVRQSTRIWKRQTNFLYTSMVITMADGVLCVNFGIDYKSIPENWFESLSSVIARIQHPRCVPLSKGYHSEFRMTKYKRLNTRAIKERSGVIYRLPNDASRSEISQHLRCCIPLRDWN